MRSADRHGLINNCARTSTCFLTVPDSWIKRDSSSLPASLRLVLIVGQLFRHTLNRDYLQKTDPRRTSLKDTCFTYYLANLSKLQRLTPNGETLKKSALFQRNVPMFFSWNWIATRKYRNKRNKNKGINRVHLLTATDPFGLDAATYAKYCITFFVFSVLPAPDSPVHRMDWSSRSARVMGRDEKNGRRC